MPFLDPMVFDNYWAVSNILFLGKILEHVMVSQLQVFLDKADYSGSFQSDFSCKYGMEMVFLGR